MKKTKSILLVAAVIISAACHVHKKNSTVAPSNPVAAVNKSADPPTPTSSVATFPIIKPANGVYPPGNEELIAIQAQYKDVTMAKLREGHTLYTQSACIQCHEPLNIYVNSPAKWKDIIIDMAQRAKITDEQRDAVYKYVLAIKATQAK